MSKLTEFFCSHVWQSHAKKEYKWTEQRVVEETKDWYTPIVETQELENTVEVLVCNMCGKVKKIEY